MITRCPRCHTEFVGWSPVVRCSCGWSSDESGKSEHVSEAPSVDFQNAADKAVLRASLASYLISLEG